MNFNTNLDVNKIFFQNNISEIEGINREIQHEIEKKREELRTMVGESFRDLIHAADTIGEMKNTAYKLRVENIRRMSEFSEKFNQQHIVGAFRYDDKIQTKRSSSKEHFFGIVAQIKLLTILLEMISSYIDDDNFLIATQLFIFSRHISTGLKLDTNKEIISKFPVAKKQWELLAPFFFTIKQHCLQALEKENLSMSESTARCLASLLLLENCQMDKLLDIFIQVRTATFLKSLQNDDNYENVKEKLLTSLKILINTAEVINECFVSHDENDNGLIIHELNNIMTSPTITILHGKSSGIFKMVPDIIAKYKPQFQLIPLQNKDIKCAITKWLQSTDEISKNQLKSLISFIVSIKTIQDIKSLVTNIETPKNYSNICQELFCEENFDFYDRFYQPYINDRIYTIINISWSNVLSEFKDEVEKFIEENEHVHRDEWHYVWNEDLFDNPLSLKDALSKNKRSHRLLMKICGYTPSIVEMCDKIDESLGLLINDLKQYLCGSMNLNKMKKIKENQNDTEHQNFVEFLRKCSHENVNDLITIIKSFEQIKSAENCVLMARLLQSFTELCLNLQCCFTGNLLIEPTFLRDPRKDCNGDEEWRKITILFMEESISFWEQWMIAFVKSWKSLDVSIDLFYMLKDFPSWEAVVISEKGENDETVVSEIFVPFGLSISIQNWIFNIISNLNKIVPHTLPKFIHLQVINHVVTHLHNYYERLSQMEFVNGNQKTAWQFLFDLKVLILVFVGRENKPMIEKYTELIAHFRGTIDPFDYDVFYKHVSKNIKKCAARLQYIAGVLVPNMEYLNGILSNPNVQPSHDKDPNVLNMSVLPSELNWFPLLPIINTKDVLVTSIYQEVDKKKQHSQKTLSSKKSVSMPSSASSSALSSLQDWFR